MSKQLVSELFLYQGVIHYDLTHTAETFANLKAYARSKHEARELHSAVGSILANNANLVPYDRNDFELEARLLHGSAEFDMNEPKNTHYEIEIRPIRGRIRNVIFVNRELEIPTTSPDSVSFFWPGLRDFYKGSHRVIIFYNPRQ